MTTAATQNAKTKHLKFIQKAKTKNKSKWRERTGEEEAKKSSKRQREKTKRHFCSLFKRRHMLVRRLRAKRRCNKFFNLKICDIFTTHVVELLFDSLWLMSLLVVVVARCCSAGEQKVFYSILHNRYSNFVSLSRIAGYFE